MLNNKTKGYSTTTYKVKLYPKHMDWLHLTRRMYNQVLEFYYRLLLENNELMELTSHKLLRQLEVLTIGEKRKHLTEPQYPIPYKKVPLYFRRAAINGAISMVRSQITRKQKNIAKSINASPVYYKGMYKQFEGGRILLKLWNGKSWVWVKYTCGNSRRIPENADILSPILKINRKTVLLHLPVVVPVEDVRTVKKRYLDKEKVCAVAFPNNKNMAVCAAMDNDGSFEHAYFIKGGSEFKHRRKYYLGRSKKLEFGNREGKQYGKFPAVNKRIKKKIHNLSDYYAHKISREIVNYCIRQNIKIIVVPKYREGLSLNQIGYIPADNYEWIGRRIISCLQYKAFQNGIVVTEVPPHHTASKCYVCKNRIKKYNEGHFANINYYGGHLYRCPLGHRGNTALNSARNLLAYYSEKLMYE